MIEGLNFAMTTIPTILLWVIGLVVFGVGALLGYVNMNVDARKKIDAMETKAENMRTEAEKKLSDAGKKLEEFQLLRTQNPGLLLDSESLLRLRKEDNRVLVEMDGKILSGALSVEGKKRLLELLGHVRPFLESAQIQQSVAKTVVQAPPTFPPTFTPAASPISNEVKPVSMLSPGQAKKLDPQKEFALLSIVQQIDSVLQKKLIGTPFEDQKISLKDSPEASVEVYIGLQKYDSIDDVPDEKIKSVIRAAISEWESKYIPGL